MASEKTKTVEEERVKEAGETSDAKDKKSPEELMRSAIKWSELIFEQNKKIKRRLGWIIFGGYVRLALILVPLILALIYLPPLVQDLLNQYESIFSGAGQGGSPLGGSFNDILSDISPEQIQQALKILGK